MTGSTVIEQRSLFSLGTVLVLGIDTSTPAVTVALVALSAAEPIDVLAERSEVTPNRHGERLGPLIEQVLAAAGHAPGDLRAIAVGLGPGPFTGLRVGVVTAAAMGDALGIPVYGECSLDALIRWPTPLDGRVAAVTDARRRQVYWATYDGSRRTDLDVAAPADLAARLSARDIPVIVGAGAAAYPEFFGEPDADRRYPPAAGIVAVAADRVLRREPGGPLSPLYLRRPDAVPPGRPKQVTPA